MAKEIERKFLVRDDSWRGKAPGVLFRQGYLSTDTSAVVRVRIAGEQAFLTVKGPTKGCGRDEFEYEIPVDDAAAMLDRLARKPLIEKYRHTFEDNGHVWEVDEFLGDNAGLVVAEVELSDEGEQVSLPAWGGKEVTGDARYYNSNLVEHPFSTWK